MSLEGKLNDKNTLRGRIHRVPETDNTLTKEGYAADAKATGDALNARVKIADVVDNLESNASDKPLSAKQGAVMREMIEGIALNVTNIEEPEDRGEFRYVGTLESNTDLNNLLATGSYSCTSSVAKTVSNTPIVDGAFHIHVFKAATPTANETSARPTIQMLTATSTTDSRLFWRKHSTGTWGEWKICEDIRDVKPRGNYSGNGSVTSRTIPVTGEGQVVLIYGGVGAVFVTPYGAYAINSSGAASFLPVAQIYKGNDGIVMTTDNALVNKSGNTYGYQLL